jgi:DNA-binding Lrp family transcriptional regulator
MDAVDRRIINELQGGFPVSDRPYAEAAERLGIAEDDLIQRLKRLCDEGALSRFGPMFNAERLGGAVTLAAVKAPAADFERIAGLINAHPEVAHNYAREDALNMWFVIATETRERIAQVIAEIEAETGLRVYDMPKIEEFYVGLRFQA